MRLIYAILIFSSVLTTLAECQKTSEDWYNEGIDLMGEQKYNNAIKAFEKATSLDSSNSQAWTKKAEVFFEMERYDDAIRACDEAIWLDPMDSWSWFIKGDALRELGKTGDANVAIAFATIFKGL
jgi:tetratricopeptide (TPR) repeat protein